MPVAKTPSAKRAPARAKKRTEARPEARSPLTRAALFGLAAVYLLVVWLDGVGSNLPARVLPRPVLFFGQIAALFRWAGQKQIDYRAEGFSCASRTWTEIDVRPYFPIDADNKENRFYRALQFHRRDRTVMQALERYVLDHANAGSEPPPFGGVRFSSLRIPYPEPGTRIERHVRRPLAEIPPDQKHDWYYTPERKRMERCGAVPPRSEP